MLNKRIDFPLLKNAVYLDSGAGVLKPVQVVNAMSDFYLKNPINPHNIDSKLGHLVHTTIIETRKKIAKLISCGQEEVIFTSGTTDSLNKFAKMYEPFIESGDEILLSPYNHSSNIVPWLELAKRKGAKVVYNLELIDGITSKTKIIAYAQMNNTLLKDIDAKALFERAREVNAIVVNDAAQAIVHATVDMTYCDVVAFSGNKLYGPTGIGVLAIREEILKNLKPQDFGGGATSSINFDGWKPTGDPIANLEPGTLNTAGIIGLGAAIDYLWSIPNLEEYETELAMYAHDKLSKDSRVKIFSKRGDVNIMFNVEGVHSQDVVSYLGARNIIMRSGLHCAQMICTIGTYNSSIRMSLAFYNNQSDIDAAVDLIKDTQVFLDI